MGSLGGCLKRLSFSKEETAHIRRLASVHRDDGLQAADANLAAVDELIADTERIKQSVLDQLKPTLSPTTYARATNGVATLVHYSRQKGLDEISPKYHGTGQIGAERTRLLQSGKGYLPRSYFYRAGTKIEPRFKGQTKYQVEVPESSLVDLATLTGTPAEREQAAKKAGYKGYYNSESSMPNVVAMFEPVQTASAQPSSAQPSVQPVSHEELASDPLFSPRTWVSQIEKVLEQKMPKSASAAQVKGILSPQNGIKPDELEAMDFDAYLTSKDKFDKHNVLEWVRAHQIQVERVTFEKRTRELTPQEIKGIEDKHARYIQEKQDNLTEAENNLKEYDEGMASARGVSLQEIHDRGGALRRMLMNRLVEAEVAVHRAQRERDEELARRSVTEDTTKYASWQLPGGVNYKEVFVTLPASPEAVIELKNWRVQKVRGEDYTFWEVTADRPNGTRFVSNVDVEEYPTQEEAILVAQSVALRHESNRANNWALIENQAETDRAGELIYDVVDSNGRVRATLPHFDAAEYAKREISKLDKTWSDGHGEYDEVINPVVRLRMNDRTTTDEKKLLFLEEIQPPNPSNQAKMPKWALKRWREIGLKQALRIAADGNYDAIGWTTGAQQADRYSLRNRITELVVYRDPGRETYWFRARRDDQEVTTQRNLTEASLRDAIGEELTTKVLDHFATFSDKIVLSGVDLELGGKGLIKVYDQDLVHAANGIAKKWGVKAGESKIQSDKIARQYRAQEWVERGEPPFVVWDDDAERVVSYHDTMEEARSALVVLRSGNVARVHTLPVTDAMKTVVKEGLPLFAPKPPVAATFTVEPPSSLDKLVRILQDKTIDIKRIVEAVKDSGKPVADELNPVLKEEMYMARTAQRTKDFSTDELLPLTNAMRLAKVSLEQLDRYLHARHVINDKVNAHLQSINPDLAGTPEYDKLAGITDAEAKTILTAANAAVMEPLAKRVDAIVEKTRNLMVAYGLEKQDTIDNWRKFYTAYVPLHREGFEEEGHPTGTGRSVRGSTVKERTGSALGVSNVLANVAQARDQIITRGEKQRPVIAMAGLLMQYPNPEIATLDKPAQIEMTDPVTGLKRMVPGNLTNYTVPTVRRFDPAQGKVVSMPDPTYKGRDNVVNFRVDGEDYAIVFNERNERAMESAKAFKELGTAKLTGVMAAIAPYTRYLASINTQYNPIFGIVNFVRDAQFAVLALGSTPLAGKRLSILNNARHSLRGIFQDARAVRKGLHPTSTTAALWERFQHVGGPTGYRDLFFSSTERSEELERMLNPNSWSTVRDPQSLGRRIEETGFMKLLSDYNVTMENAIRLGVFKTAVDQGLSDIQAASLAKNITVNFNKKGQIGAQMGSLYAFFNANVQGTARIVETLFDRQKNGGFTLSAYGKRLIAGGILTGVLQTFALTMAGFGDDDPPEYIKARNLVIPIPGTQKGYGLIPMPLGFNLLPNVGRMAAEAVRAGVEGKDLNVAKRAAALVSAMYGTFSPMGGTGGVIQELSPTAIDPLVALESNKDWTGKSIAKEDRSTLDPTPGHTRARDTASAWAMFLSRAINWATGGTDYTPGVMSPTPDAVDYFIEQLTGGIGREMSKSSQVLQSMITGEELPFHKIPLAGRFAGSVSGTTAIRDRFYDNIKEVNLAYREFEGRAKDRKPNAHEFLRLHPTGRLHEAAISVERTIGELKQAKHELVRKGAPREAIRLREQQITGMMERFNRLVEERKEGAAP